MAPTAASLSQTQLLAYVEEHVAYELESVGAAFAVSRRYPISQPEHRVGVEGVLLHARCLDEFFSRVPGDPGVRPSDVLAIIAAPKWKPASAIPPNERTKINLTLAHLTTARLALVGSQWNLRSLAAQVADVSEAFAGELPTGPARTRLENMVTYVRQQR